MSNNLRNMEVKEHASELTKLVEELKNEIAEKEKAEAKFRAVVEQSLVGFYIIKDGKFSYINPQFAKIFGYTQEELTNTHPVETVIHPADREMVAENVRARMEGEIETIHYEANGLKKNGETIRIEIFCSGCLEEKTKTIMGTLLDITERTQAEDKLRQSENLLAEAEQIAQIGSWSLDLLSNIVTWSEELYRIFGVKKSEFDHRLESIFEFIHPDDRDFVKGIVENAVKTQEPYNFYFRLVRPDGKVRIIHARGGVTIDEHGNALRMYGASQDVTERRQAEDDLRLAYQRLSYHVENTPLAVIEWDKELNITRWSGQAAKIFGWKASEVLGRNKYDLDSPIVYKEDEEKVAKVDYELMNGLVDRNLSLSRNYTKDGKVIYCEWYNSVLRDNAGNVITILSLTQNVTERKKAEEKLNESYEQIRSLSQHLRSIREEERKYIAREIHDELGQHLTVLKMDVGTVNKKLHNTDDVIREKLAALSYHIDRIVESVRRIASELRPSLLDELGLAAAIAWHLEEFEKQTGIKTYFTEPKEEWNFPEPVKTNLFRILQESLTNVARHSHATEVKVDLAESHEKLILTIADNGVGFDDEDGTEKKTLGILGMKERAAIIEGTYEIQSQPGKGTIISVTVLLPVN